MAAMLLEFPKLAHVFARAKKLIWLKFGSQLICSEVEQENHSFFFFQAIFFKKLELSLSSLHSGQQEGQ